MDEIEPDFAAAEGCVLGVTLGAMIWALIIAAGLIIFRADSSLGDPMVVGLLIFAFILGVVGLLIVRRRRTFIGRDIRQELRDLEDRDG